MKRNVSEACGSSAESWWIRKGLCPWIGGMKGWEMSSALSVHVVDCKCSGHW